VQEIKDFPAIPLYMYSMVRMDREFIEDSPVTQQVPYNREKVNEEALGYCLQDLKLKCAML
jgi:hypothetical protein